MDRILSGLSPSLVSAVVVQLLCQLFKVIWYSLRDGRLRFGYLFTAGGMPSAHSAFVTALTVSLGLRHGLGSDLFGLSVVFSLIIIYDSIRLRGTVQLHARLLQDLLNRRPAPQPGAPEAGGGAAAQPPVEVPQMVGHTLPEVIAGILAGGGFAGLVRLLL